MHRNLQGEREERGRQSQPRDSVLLRGGLSPFGRSGSASCAAASAGSMTRPASAAQGPHMSAGRSTVSAMDTETWLTDTRASYDAVAEGYAGRIRDALAGLPRLRAGFALFAEAVHAAGPGPVADVGCGSGRLAAHLDRLGVRSFGIDLSTAMLEVAKHEHPAGSFAAGSMTALPLADASMAGLVAFWSIIHVPDHALPACSGSFGGCCGPADRSCWVSTPAPARGSRPKATAGVR